MLISRRSLVVGAAALASYSTLQPAAALFGGKRVLLGHSYAPESKALFSAMTVHPDANRKGLINSTIKALKSAGIWSQLDILYVLAAHDSQAARLNWINPVTFTALPSATSPTFATDRGYTGNGSSSYLRTQYTPSTNGVKYQRNNASLWVWINNNATTTVGDIGNSSTAPLARLLSRYTTNAMRGAINDGTVVDWGSTSTSIGLSGLQRRGATDRRAWQNGVQLGATDNTASTGLPLQEQWMCGASDSTYSTHQEGAAAWGASLAGLELTFTQILQRYMRVVGATS